MWPESNENPHQKVKPVKLRTGLTTGTCSTACVIAAIHLLLGHKKITRCAVTLPRGKIVSLAIKEVQMLGEKTAYAATIKDAGDDPDVTHGASIFVRVSLLAENGIDFIAAEGVGIVTLPGLALSVGEPAINVTPRKMIRQQIKHLKKHYAYQGGFSIAIGVHNGENIAKKTMNPRLGIIGGLSILGTTGIVRPFSCAAYIASIHQGVDVALANQVQHIAACTGNLSEAFARETLKLNDIAILEMGDFAGAVFKYLKRHPVKQLSLCGGFGKITKLAAGHQELHSKKSAIDFDFLAQCAAQVGLGPDCIQAIKQANTSIEVLSLLENCELNKQSPGELTQDFTHLICYKAWLNAKTFITPKLLATEKTAPAIHIDIWAINRQGELIGHYNEQAVA